LRPAWATKWDPVKEKKEKEGRKEGREGRQERK
jgi:hypothetical protein